MFLLNGLSVALALASSACAFPTVGKDDSFKSSVVEKLTGPPAGWVKDDSIHLDKDDSMMRLRIHLVNQDMKKFHDFAMRVRSRRKTRIQQC
jgi:tripeptidyl-peptidase-1